MPISRDPDTLRIPAFMRRKRLRTKIPKLEVTEEYLASKSVIKKRPVRAQSKKRQTQRPIARAARKKKATVDFAPPILKVKTKVLSNVGTITHYYDKIKVGVIKLSRALRVGDEITFETADGRCTQVVASMEVDRHPVFRATRGQEIGIKLSKSPRIGSKVSV